MKRIILFISLILLAFAINAQSVTANQLNGRLSISAASNVADSTWSITGTFSNSVNKYVPSQIAVNDKLFVQIGANTYVGRISVINSYSDVTRLITFRVICNYPNPPNSGSTIAAIVRATSNGYPVWVDGIPNALQAGIQNYFATLINTNAAGNPCEKTITKTNHGFSKGTPVKRVGGTYVRPTNDTIIPDFIVVDSLTANTFKVSTCGIYTSTLPDGLYWFTSAAPGYSLTQDTIKVPLFQVLNDTMILNPIVGFNLMSGSGNVTSSVLADTAAAIRADFPTAEELLPAGLTNQIVSYDRNNVATVKYPGNPGQLLRRGSVVAHIGDSNTNGRPGYRDSYTAEMFCADCPFGGSISYNIGSNGSTLQGWRQSVHTTYATDSLLKDFGVVENPGTHVKRLTAGDAQGRKPDLVFVSLGTNDMNNPGARASYGRYSAMKKNLDTLVNWILDNTEAHVFLRMPNPFTYTGSFSALCSWTNPAEAAAYSDTLRLLYLDWKNINPRVSVYDSHADVFGFGSQNEDPGDVVDPAGGGALMDDNLYPSGIGYRRVVQGILKQIDPSFPRHTEPLDTTPVDYWRFAKWSRSFYLRGAATSVSGNNRVLELDVATQFNRIGASGYGVGAGRVEDTKLAELMGVTNPLPMYTELIDVGKGASDTVYVYSISSKTTMKLTGISLSQWVTNTNPDYVQVQGTAQNSVTLPAGTVIIYSKLKAPFVPSTSTLVFTTGNSGGVTISPTGSNSALTLTGGSSTGNTLNVTSTQQDTKNIVVTHTGWFRKQGLQMTLSTDQTFLVNAGEEGIQIENSSTLDGYWARGIYSRAVVGRSAKGTNSNLALPADFYASSAIATAGIYGYGVRATAQTNNITSVYAVGSGSGMLGNLFEGFNNGAVRFTVDPLGKVGAGISTASTAYLHSAASTTAAASLRIPSGTAPSSPNEGDIWNDGSNLKYRTGGVSYNLSRTLGSQNNVTTGTTDGSGDLTVTFAAAMPDATYSLLATVEGTTSYTISVHTKATGTCKVRFFDPTTGTAVTATSVTISYEAKDY